jgi:putative heme-binding domain-containing protein
VLQSILEPDAYRVPGFGVMPKNVAADLTDEHLRDLIAYIVGPSHESTVAPLNIPPREPAPDQIDISLAEAQLGEKVFREKGKCLSCHSYYQAPEYHTFAPNLLQGGYRDVEAVKKAIINPSETVANEYKSTRIQTVDGLLVSGRRIKTENDQIVRLLVQAADGKFNMTTIEKVNIETDDEGNLLMDVIDVSPMPSDFGKQLTPEEIEAVAKLIVSLNE